MAEFIVMPKLGFDMREAVLNRWLKKIGDSIEKGEIIAEIESDKATLELEAQASGMLLHLLAEAGEVMPIGANLAIVGDEGEDISGMMNGGAAPAAKAKKEELVESSSAPVAAPPATTTTPAPTDNAFPGGIKATPVARRIAEEKGIDLRLVNGTGPDGRIRKADVEAYQPAPVVTAAPAAFTPIVAGPESTEVVTSKLRQAIGRRMIESKTTVPHFYVTTEIDMAPALELRKQINAALPEGEKVTVNDMIIKAAALTLRDFPKLNANYNGATLIMHNRINIGSAVAVEGGLLTVVQKNTDVTPLAQIARDNKAMIGRARDGKVKPEDVEGSTFTVSNLGAYDVENFIAIINPPDAAILAVGSAREVPAVVNGQLAVGVRMKATISADHRVTDGAEAAQFMQAFKTMLETPMRLLL
ncbi:MAG: 2-oxo acid dehydrogenase subunit E2 [Ardenticatenaceae bacterium]|nr:2-oxo acid dehydrogenase subunit E2 [Ardenticatenaceae bacterium]MCB9443215.1 2-oxo acid dehydrogenase subunit E2 [Ardenticatenaceae bacterium]